VQSDSAPGAMRLGDYLVLVRRQWAIVLVGLLVGGALAAGYMALAPREYTSQTSVLVTATTGGLTGVTPRAAEINLDTEARLVTSTETLSNVAAALGLSSAELADLGERVTVTVPPNTEILTISFVAPTAAAAQEGAQAFAQAYLDIRRATADTALNAEDQALQSRIDAVTAQLQQVTEAGAGLLLESPQRVRNEDQAAALRTQLANLGSQQNQVRAETVTPGRVVTQPGLPSAPSSPDPVQTGLAGGLLGLLGGLGLAALRHRADDCIRTPEDLLRRTGVPAAAVLATAAPDDAPIFVRAAGADGRAYARLRTQIVRALENAPRRVVVLSGVQDGGGAVAAHVAAALARFGQDVRLVCADPFSDTADDLLGEPRGAGLGELLTGEETVDRVVHRFAALPSLGIIGPGRDADRADLLVQSPGPREVVDRLLETSSYVVVEAPPVGTDRDLSALTDLAGVVVLVAEAGRTTGRDITDALAFLQEALRPVLLVLSPAAGSGGGPRAVARSRAAGVQAPAQPPRLPAAAGRDPVLR
jgi:uncharacterized protein involved in exopolysaccharide biosynthesis/Mrp family chromosome partitioning ATPase